MPSYWTRAPIHIPSHNTKYTNSLCVSVIVLAQYTGCPKKRHFLNCCFAKLGLKIHGLPLPVKQLTGSGRPCALIHSFAKLQFRKCLFQTPCNIHKKYMDDMYMSRQFRGCVSLGTPCIEEVLCKSTLLCQKCFINPTPVFGFCLTIDPTIA